VAQFDVGLRQCGLTPFSHRSLRRQCDAPATSETALRIAQCDVGLVSCAFAGVRLSVHHDVHHVGNNTTTTTSRDGEGQVVRERRSAATLRPPGRSLTMKCRSSTPASRAESCSDGGASSDRGEGTALFSSIDSPSSTSSRKCAHVTMIATPAYYHADIVVATEYRFTQP